MLRRTFRVESNDLSFKGFPSRARQEFLNQSNINVVVSRYCKTGVLPLPNAGREPVDGLECPPDFQEAYELSLELKAEKKAVEESSSASSGEIEVEKEEVKDAPENEAN